MYDSKFNNFSFIPGFKFLYTRLCILKSTCKILPFRLFPACETQHRYPRIRRKSLFILERDFNTFWFQYIQWIWFNGSMFKYSNKLWHIKSQKGSRIEDHPTWRNRRELTFCRAWLTLFTSFRCINVYR